MSETQRTSVSWPKWSPEEDAILLEIWKLSMPLKVTVARLPGRSARGLGARAKALELPARRLVKGTSDTRPAFVALWAALRKKRGTCVELAARVHVSRQTAGFFITHFRAQMHIAGWQRQENGPPAPIFAAGAGKDKPRPARKPRADVCRDYWARLKRDRPDAAAARIARTTFKQYERKGKLIRRDPAAIALFGAAGGAPT